MLVPPALALLAPALLAAASPAPPPMFQLRVWRNWKAGPPYLDANPQLAGGCTVVNRTLGYRGFATVRLSAAPRARRR